MPDTPRSTTAPKAQPRRSRGASRADQPGSAEHALRERVKELNCLYGISRLAQVRELPLEELLRQTAELVRTSWQYPETACVRIRLDGLDVSTPGFAPSPWSQASPIHAQDEELGDVEVRYLEPRPEADEGPFLREERHLIDAVADKLGRIALAGRNEAHLRALSRELIKAQETERLRIATELHDHLAQDLASHKLDVSRLAEDLADAPESVRQRLAGLEAGLCGAIAAIRDLAYDLLPPGLEDLGLVRTLARYCADLSGRGGPRVEFFADGLDGVRLDFETQINIYRLVQESLNNVRKHARASRVTVRLIGSHPTVILRIEDNGMGVDLEGRQEEFYQGKKMGLWGMRERTRLLGGRISLRSSPGKGMRIHIEIPAEKG